LIHKKDTDPQGILFLATFAPPYFDTESIRVTSVVVDTNSLYAYVIAAEP
jgi:hypothetical protein